MALQDFLLRARRPASLVAFNGALPENFKLIHKPESMWVELPGVNLAPVASLMLLDGDPPTLSNDIHYNLRVTDAWAPRKVPLEAPSPEAGWNGLFITDPADPDYDDPTLNKSKVKQWFKNNGVERLDMAAEHPRSDRTMRWFRWTDGTEWLDITIDEPYMRRRVWL